MKSIRHSLVLTALCSLLLVTLCPAVEPGFIPLFEGQQIKFWKQSGKGGMKLKEGVGTTWFPDEKGYYGVAWFSQRMFSDFELRVEFLALGTQFNSGLRLRFPDPDDDPGSVSKNGYEVCINHPGAGDTFTTGGIQRSQPPTSSPLRPQGQWNDLSVVVTGQHYVVTLNGQVVNDFTGNKNLSGYIGIENHKSGPVQFRNVRIKDLSGAPQQLTAAPTASLSLDPNQPLLDTFSQLAPNASAWVLAALDEGVPPNVRQNLTYLREDLLDEYKQKPKASQEAYKLAHQLCSTMITALDERDQTLVRAGFRAVQADAGISGTNQALQARRNYMMSWPQYAREQAQRTELIRQGTAGAQVGKALPKVEWSTRTAKLRKTLDDLYAQFREALRQSAAGK
jgi:hypothetical protein